MRLAIYSLALLLAVPGSAQTNPPAAPTPHQRSLAAGYVALTTCSALFNTREAGGVRRADDVRMHELRGIYSELAPLITAMTPVVAESRVTVAWDAAMPPRLAVHRPGRGCMIMPVGTAADWRPRAVLPPPPRIPRPANWPVGDMQVVPPASHVPLGRDEEGARAANIPDYMMSDWVLPPLQAGPVAQAFAAHYGAGSNTTGVVIVHHGRIVGERYADGFGVHVPQRTWSVAKSIAATLVGAAVQRGDVDVMRPARIANWQQRDDPRRAITLDQLLRMSSGLTSDAGGSRTDALYFGGVAVDEQAPSWPLVAPPGSTYRYANNDTLLAMLAISPGFTRHPPSAFFARINMHATVAETDWRGNYVLSSQVWATARDLARFGMLYLNNGEWEGRRILPENWRAYVTRPSGPQPPGAFGYGASFWLMNRSEGVPPDAFAAFGNRGQYVVIIPSRDVVIVRRGEDPAGQGFDIAAFTRDVLATLQGG